MKSITKIVLVAISLVLTIIITTTTAKSLMKSCGDRDCKGGENKTPSFSKLVTVERPQSLCRPVDETSIRKFKKPGDSLGLEDNYDVFAGPKVRPNNYAKETEKYEQTVYFFDYLDDILQPKMVKEFKSLLEEAKKVPEEDSKSFDDPYTAEKLLFYFSGGTEGRDPWNGTDQPVKKISPELITRYKQDFNPSTWEQSFSAARISNIIKAFGWGKPANIPYYFKRLIDKYAFSGNGRLDAREFIFYAIMENYKSYNQCKKFCFKRVIEEVIDPLFTFLDCDNDGYINSESIWEGFKYLKRSDSKKFSFYNCILPRAYNKYYRTHAPNDFVLKNVQSADGYLSREEFRKGILLGYWERQVNGLAVVTDDSVNRKAERWDSSGIVDKDCMELLQMYQKKN